MANLKNKDPNVPILEFKIGEDLFKLKMVNVGEELRCEYNPDNYWRPKKTASLIVIRRCANGVIKEIEHAIFNPSIWGWIGRLMDKNRVEVLTESDIELATRTGTEGLDWTW